MSLTSFTAEIHSGFIGGTPLSQAPPQSALDRCPVLMIHSKIIEVVVQIMILSFNIN